MNIVKTFSVFYQNKDVEIKIEKIKEDLFIGHCNIIMLNSPIDYNQSGESIKDVESKMMSFFNDKKVKNQLDCSNN